MKRSMLILLLALIAFALSCYANAQTSGSSSETDRNYPLQGIGKGDLQRGGESCTLDVGVCCLGEKRDQVEGSTLPRDTDGTALKPA